MGEKMQNHNVDKILNAMSNPKPNHNKEILILMEKLWNKYHRHRLGQLLENFVFIDGERGDKTSQKIYYQSDEKNN